MTVAEKTVQPIAYDFAVKTKLICKDIAKQQHEYNMTDQLSRSSSSIIANLTESEYAASRADFLRNAGGNSRLLVSGMKAHFCTCIIIIPRNN